MKILASLLMIIYGAASFLLRGILACVCMTLLMQLTKLVQGGTAILFLSVCFTCLYGFLAKDAKNLKLAFINQNSLWQLDLIAAIVMGVAGAVVGAKLCGV